MRSITSPKNTNAHQEDAKPLSDDDQDQYLTPPPNTPFRKVNQRADQRTPEKAISFNRMRNAFSKSSENSRIYSWKSNCNPYEKFQDGDEYEQQAPQQSQHIYEGMIEDTNKLDKQSPQSNQVPSQHFSSQSSKEKNRSKYALSFNREYNQMLRMIRENEQIQIPRPFFLLPTSSQQTNLTKLICFPINSKNGKYIKFDASINTCRPFFKCQGCQRQFEIASALGGHLSKCNKKNQHHSMRNSYQSQEIIIEEDVEDSDEVIEISSQEREEQQPLQPAKEKGSKKIRKTSDKKSKNRLRIKRTKMVQIQTPFKSSPRKQEKGTGQGRQRLTRSAKSKAQAFFAELQEE